MKRLFTLVLILCSAASLLVLAVGPDDQYVKIYALIQEADDLNRGGQTREAYEKYRQADAMLKNLKSTHPAWNQSVVEFRIRYIAEKLQAPKFSAVARTEQRSSGAVPAEAAQSVQQRESAVQSDQQSALLEEVRRLQAENTVLQAKLREALSIQPAAVDPRELAKAEEKIRELEKERDLLKVALEAKERDAASQPQTAAPHESSEIAELKKALAESSERLKQQAEKVTALAREKEILETRLQSVRKADQAVAALEQENAALKKQLSDFAARLNSAPNAAPDNSARLAVSTTEPASADSVAQLRSALAQLQQEKASLEKTRAELEKKLAETPALPVKPSLAEAERVKQLEKERDDLLRRLNDTSKQLYDNKAKTEAVQRNQQLDELAILRARLEVFEARKVPYTPEELALLKQPALHAATDPKANKKSVRELPKGAAPLLAEAERAFAARRYGEAEQKFLQVLRMDEKNVFTLANLAAAQIEQGRFADAEANLDKALAEDSSDAHALLLKGILRFRQEQYEDALDLLSRSAQNDPRNPETQNYLGITLSQLGQRGPAETALRKAVQLSPGYSGAHHNLAVVYATQRPPFIELARWHYQKALAAGHPHNPELEKLLERTQAASAQ